MVCQVLTEKQLKTELHYEPETGIFTRLKAAGGVKAGERAGGPDAHGHRTVSVLGKRYRAARLAFLYMTGAFPEGDADHINRDRLDDRWENLRDATRAQNLANMGRKTGRKKGVCFVTEKSRWKAQIRHGGKNHHLGYFDTEDEASAAYAAEAKRVHGVFARW